jgi:hypothetical protein
MNASLLVLLSTIIAPGWPNVRIDHQRLPNHDCHSCAISVGPSASSSQPVYVVFEDDSASARADIMFQKSTDAGRTWLHSDVLVRQGSRFALYPDIAADSCGNIYVVYVENDALSHHVFCVQSTDGGATWLEPAQVDDHTSGGVAEPQIAVDSAGSLLVAWNHGDTDDCHIFSSVSTDRGATWSPRVRVCNDTVPYGCYHAETYVQPGTNQYLVVATSPRYETLYVVSHAYLYRSFDRGQTFRPGVQLDTFGMYTGPPHVVADRDHVICDFTGQSDLAHYGYATEARTLYTQQDTWGRITPVTNLDTFHSSCVEGAKLALSADGRVHTALMVFDIVNGDKLIYYASSTNQGVSWTAPELVNDDSAGNEQEPDIAVDSAGCAYIAWRRFMEDSTAIWFATNSPAAIAEQPLRPSIGVQQSATVIRNVLFLPEASSRRPRAAGLMDVSGRRVMNLRRGANDVRALPPGVYVIEAGPGLRAKVVKLK